MRMSLALSYIMNFKLFQMDVKNEFLNGYIQYEVLVYQPFGFINLTFIAHVFKLNKALYDLKQAHRV